MVTVFSETLSRILKPGFVIIYLLGLSIVSVASTLIIRYFFSSSILQGQIITYTSFFVMLCYFWVLGFPLVIWLIHNGIGLFARERDEGTLLLLLSKPLSRNHIFLGKYLALMLSSLLLGSCSIFLSITGMTLFVFPDDKIALYLLKIVPSLGIYLFFLTISLSIVSVGLSFYCRSRKKLLIGLLIFVVIVYIILPVLRISYLDSIYFYFITLTKKIMFSPVLQLDIVVSPIIALVSWLLVCFFVLILALQRLKNLDISTQRQ
jgi:ABC-type transport system involved in multi-copper enzyme maturation permease subunit